MRKTAVLAMAFLVLSLAVGLGTAGATAPSGVTAQTVLDVTSGTNRVVIQVLTFQPGGSSGWHSHGGTTRVVIVAGVGTHYTADCAAQTFVPGTTFTEQPGEVGLLRNDGATPLVVWAVYDLRGGAAVRLDEPAPLGCPVR